MTIKIMQETCIIGMPSMNSHHHNTRIKKYHISQKGTARKNKWWNYYLSKSFANPSKKRKYEIEVERVVDA